MKRSSGILQGSCGFQDSGRFLRTVEEGTVQFEALWSRSSTQFRNPELGTEGFWGFKFGLG